MMSSLSNWRSKKPEARMAFRPTSGFFGKGGIRMKILEVKALAIPEIKVIRFARFADARGFFSELFRKSDFGKLDFQKGIEFLQCNESYSRAGTVRGLHFQWNPTMGKLVRTLSGRMVDLVLDIRRGSPTFGKVIAYDMPGDSNAGFGEWIWVPPGFAHGNYFDRESRIEYFCTGEYNPDCEAGISPISEDIDWSLCDPLLKSGFHAIMAGNPLISEKDRNGHTLSSWIRNPNSDLF
jgi:dTDP-4-dehydrorhamnose 3,5-epimerase